MLVDLFSQIEKFFKRLELYTEVQPPAAIMSIIVEIMVEVLAILAIATRRLNKGDRVSRSTPITCHWLSIL
jgi:hypothetical protein